MSPGPAPDVLVVGGGIVGLACARALVQRGASVELVERDGLGQAASAAAAGMLAPLAEAGTAGVFFETCRGARDAWPAFVEALEDESRLFVDYDRKGTLVVDPEGGTELDAVAATARGRGEPWARLCGDDLRLQIPDLSPGIDDAVLLPGDHRVDNRLVCRALARVVRAAGVTVREGQMVTSIATLGDGVRVEGPGWSRHAGAVVLAAGAGSAELEGIPPLPVVPVRGEMLRLRDCRWPWRGSVRAAGLYAVRRTGNGLLVGATMDEGQTEPYTTPAGQHTLTSFVARVFPMMARAPIARSWAGIRPGTPDHLPLIGPVEPGVWVATGHFRNGILLAPWTAERIVSALLDGDRDAVPEAFSPERFAATPA